MLGRSIGIPDEKLAHLRDEPLPEDIYTSAEQAIIRYARASTLLEPIDDELYADLARHYDVPQQIAICLTIGLSNLVNRFHATFHTDVDERTLEALGGQSPLPLPPEP